MSCLDETRKNAFYETSTIFLEHVPLIPIEDYEAKNHETWLYVLERCLANSTFVQEIQDLAVVNASVAQKEASQWLDNIRSEDVLVEDINPPSSVETSEGIEQGKIIDTRTYTRPRKQQRLSSFQPSVVAPHSVEIDEANLNSTFSHKTQKTVASNNCDIMNTTVVFEELNATFQIENGTIAEETLSPPNNNNVYHLNTTFPTQHPIRTSPLPADNKVLNSTFMLEEEPVHDVDNAIQPSPIDVDEDDESDQLSEEAVFLKPLLPGAVPKRGLVRTSTLKIESSAAPSQKMISPPQGFALKDIETAAKLQQESLAQTSTPMGQRQSAFRRPAEVEEHLGSPISSLGDADSVGSLNGTVSVNDTTKTVRGQLTFEKSQNSIEMQSNSPSSPADSPYSSQSLESETAGAALTKEDLIRRSMPNLNHPTKLRLPNPGSAMSSNLNRLHGSDSGLRPPLVHQSSQLPVGQVLNGSQLRPQLRPPQSSSSVAMNVDCQSAAGKTTNALTQQHKLPTVGLQAPVRSSVPAGLSKLKPPQLMAPRLTAPKPVAVVNQLPVADNLNATQVVDKPSIGGNSNEIRPSSGIPRPQMSKLPTPRPKSSIPTMAFRPRAPQ